MKKIVIILLSVLSYLSSDTYYGIDIGSGLNEDKVSVDSYSGKFDNKYKDISFVLGSGNDSGVRYQGRLSIISFDKPLYDDTNNKMLEMGVDIIKEWGISSQFFPYVKAGMSGGYIKVDDEYYNTSIATAVAVNAGLGISYKATDDFSILFGIDYFYRKYQDVEVDSTEISSSGNGVKPYLGIRYGY